MICRAVRDEIRNDAVDVPDEHEVVVVVDLEQGILLPCVLSVTDAGAEHLGKADAAAFPQPQRCRAGIKGMDKPGLVLGKDVPFGIFFHQPFDAPPVGKQILPCVGVQRLDAVLRMIEQRDALIQRVNLSDGVVQISRLFGLRILCEVGDADQDAVFSSSEKICFSSLLVICCCGLPSGDSGKAPPFPWRSPARGSKSAAG